MSLVPPDPPLSDGVIILRPMNESDLPTIERAASDAEILKWFDLHTRSPAGYLAAKREAWAEGTGASFAICDATRPDTCLGQVFIERDDDGRGSVGYWLLEDGRGKGRATRAVRLMASWALPEMRLGRLQLHTDPENVASQRVAERAGFTREGVFRAYNGRRDGTRADAFVYSLLPQDLASTRFANSSYELGRRLGQCSGMSHEACSRPNGVTVNGVSTREILLAHPRKGVPVSAEENTRLVQTAYEAFGRGDMAALGEVMADDIEWLDPGDPDDDPNAGTFKGKEAALGWFGGLASTLDYTTFEPREFIAQNDKVVSLVYSEATVRETGRAFVNHEAHVWTFRDGKLARFQSYHDTAAAAAAHRVE